MKSSRVVLACACLAVALGMLFILSGCEQALPPGPSTVFNCTASDGSTVNCGTGNGTNAQPSPSPSPAFPKPDYIKISLYGDQRCPDGVSPSTEDRTVRKGCTVAMTISPKCKRTPPDTGPDVDCKIADDAEPESFGVIFGAEHVLVSPQADNPRFNRNVTGVSAGLATFSGSYQGQRVRDDFVLTVVP